MVGAEERAWACMSFHVFACTFESACLLELLSLRVCLCFRVCVFACAFESACLLVLLRLHARQS